MLLVKDQIGLQAELNKAAQQGWKVRTTSMTTDNIFFVILYRETQ
jgi:hypothetical protein